MRRYRHVVSVKSKVSLAGSFMSVAWILVAATAAESPRQAPTAAEIVRLHSTCAAWGQQILEGNLVRSALYQQQFTRYSPRTNRCYVEMRIQTAELNEPAARVGRFLYDGQTKELLAFAQIKNGEKSGRVFDLHHRTTSYENGGWDDASQYISATMMDDR